MTLAVENTPAIVLSDVCRKITPLSLKLSFVAVETSISTTSPSGVRYVTVAAIEFLSHSISSVNFIGGTVSSSQNGVDCEVRNATGRLRSSRQIAALALLLESRAARASE